MKLYDDNGREVTNPKVLNFLKALEELAGDTLHEQEEDDYSDLEIYTYEQGHSEGNSGCSVLSSRLEKTTCRIAVEQP